MQNQPLFFGLRISYFLCHPLLHGLLSFHPIFIIFTFSYFWIHIPHAILLLFIPLISSLLIHILEFILYIYISSNSYLQIDPFDFMLSHFRLDDSSCVFDIFLFHPPTFSPLSFILSKLSILLQLWHFINYLLSFPSGPHFSSSQLHPCRFHPMRDHPKLFILAYFILTF